MFNVFVFIVLLSFGVCRLCVKNDQSVMFLCLKRNVHCGYLAFFLKRSTKMNSNDNER